MHVFFFGGGVAHMLLYKYLTSRNRTIIHLPSVKNNRTISPPGIIDKESFDPWSVPQLSGEQQPSETQIWKGEAMDAATTGSVFSRFARSPISEEVLEALRSADRKSRDVVVGLSNACCKWGCSKSEISSLC